MGLVNKASGKKSVGLGLIGGGVVGGGVVETLRRNGALMQSRSGIQLDIARMAVRDMSKDRGIPAERITADWRAVVDDPAVDVVVELMGGTSTAHDVVWAALKAGKPVVTANKALLAERGADLFALSSEAGVPIYFEASVAGGIPIIKALREGLQANRIERITGIINGTCNYILSRMAREGATFESVLTEAKVLGFAEADESLDVDGIDAAHKAAILAALAYGFLVPFNGVFVEGIRDITPLDMGFADKLGYRIKLLATVRGGDSNEAEVRVHPALVPRDHMLAEVGGVFNAIEVVGDVVGSTLFYGRGAGANPTASAVLADILEAAACVGGGSAMREAWCPGSGSVRPMNEVVLPFYARLTVRNQPGVLAQVAEVFGRHRIGISSVFQPEDHVDTHVPLVFLLDKAREADMRSAIDEIKKLDVVGGPCQIIRVEELS